MGRIADILQARGQLNEALRIRRQEQLPIYERLRDLRSALVARTDMALNLIERGREGDRQEAAELLRSALADADRLGGPESDQIRGLIEKLAIR